MFIIGQPKTLTDLEIVPNTDLDGLAKFIDNLIKEGTPLEIPQAMTLLDMGRLIRTAIHYRDSALPPAVEEERPSLIIPPVDAEGT